MIRSKFEKCEKLFEQTQAKPEEALEFELTQRKYTFSYSPSNKSGFGSWLIGLGGLEV